MPELTPEQRAGEIITIRTKIRANKVACESIGHDLKEILRKYGIEVDDAIAGDLTIALTDEITKLLVEVDLPGGTNCAAM